MNILIIDDSKETGVCIWMAENKIGKGKLADAEIYQSRTYKQGMSQLIGLPWNILLLDHDLGESKTGYDLLVWLYNNKDKGYIPKRIYSITNNPVGEQNMLDLLSKFKEEGFIDDYA
jgi:hypothetical protein